MTFFLLLLYFLAFPFGQLIRIDLSNITLQPVDLIASLIGIWGTITFRSKIKSSKLFLPLVSFLAVASYSIIFNAIFVTPSQLLVGMFYLARISAYLLFYLSLASIVRHKSGYKEKLQKALVWGGVANLALGLAQYLLIPDTRWIAQFGWDPHYFRLIGSHLDPAFTGILLVFFVLLVLGRVWGREVVVSYWAFALLGITAIAATFSRASYVSLVIGMAIMYIVRRSIITLILLLAFFVIVVVILPKPGGEGVRLERSSTISLRLENYQKTLEIASQKPLFGVGFNLIKYSKNDVSKSHSAAGASSSLLFVLATTGIVGFLIFLSVLHKIGVQGCSLVNTDSGLVLFASSLALFIHSFFNNSLFYPWVIGWIAILLVLQED